MFQNLQGFPNLPLPFGPTYELQKLFLYLFQTLQVPFGLLSHSLLLILDEIDITLLAIASFLKHPLQLILRLLV